MAFEVNDINQIAPPWYNHFVNNKHLYYSTYHVPKTELKNMLAKGYELPYSRNNIPASEKKHWRIIDAPVDILKNAQEQIKNKLYQRKFSYIDHCVTGRNRYTAMKPHAGNSIVIGLDIKNAFPSVSKEMVRMMLISEGFSAEEVEIYSELSTFHDRLPQGSPCSPAMLNLVRKPLDLRLEAAVKTKCLGVVTVYVDNYFISSNEPEMNKEIGSYIKIARECGFNINRDKVHIMRKGHRMNGLGLVVAKSNVGKITVQPNKKYRDRVRAILHQAELALKSGSMPRNDFDINVARGMVETLKGSVYYGRFKSQLDSISTLLNGLNAINDSVNIWR